MIKYPNPRKEFKIIIACLFLIFVFLFNVLIEKIPDREDAGAGSVGAGIGFGIICGSLILGSIALLYLYIKVSKDDLK